MLKAYPLSIARETKGHFSSAYRYVSETCQQFHLNMLLTEIEMWKDCGGSDVDFCERFESVFPPGYLRRNLQGAKNVVYDLLDILQSDIVRSELKPIYTYVMRHIISEKNEELDDYCSPEERIPEGLENHLREVYVDDKEKIRDILDWFRFSEICICDFEEQYNEDYMNKTFAEQIAQIYLDDQYYREKLQILGVDISDFFDLLPTDLWERCIKKYTQIKESVGNEAIMQKYDYFISHASEDKKVVAEPQANALKRLGAKVWLDKYELNIGDSLRESIDNGLRSAEQGIVILSPIYFEKFWTTKELNGLFAKASKGNKIILPIRHNITAAEVAERSTLLADLFSLSTDKYTIDEIAQAIFRTK